MGDGDEVIALTNEAAKGRRGGRAIPIAKDSKSAFSARKAEAENNYRKSPCVITGERSVGSTSYTIVSKFSAW